MSHLILGVDSPVPGPGLASEMVWCLPKPWKAGHQTQALGGPSCLAAVTAVYMGWGAGGAQGRVRALAASVASLAATGDLGQEFKAERQFPFLTPGRDKQEPRPSSVFRYQRA